MLESNFDIEERVYKLSPFKDLPSGDRLKMAKRGTRIQKEQEFTMYASDFQDQLIYLVEGNVDVCHKYVNPQRMTADMSDSLKPLFYESEDEDNHIIARSPCVFLVFDRSLFNRLIEKEIIVDERPVSQSMSDVERSIYNEVMQAVESGALQLPSLPEIALRIHKAVEQPDVDIDQISRLIELDPALSARLIKVANSPATLGSEPIRSMRDVVVRMGLKMTRSLVLNFSAAQLFKSKYPVLKKQMKKFYAHSLEVASICYALGTRVSSLEAEELLLAGLIHDIGVIPIISYIEKAGLEFTDEAEIETIINSLRVAVGVMVVKSWDLPKEMLNVVTYAEHWMRDSGCDLCAEDVVIIAQIYDCVRRKQVGHLPDFLKIPAFKKIFPDKQNPEFAMDVLDQARDEITMMKGLLGI